MRLISVKFVVLLVFILILLGLNLLIGSVSVPFKSVLNIILGQKGDNELWNYIKTDCHKHSQHYVVAEHCLLVV